MKKQKKYKKTSEEELIGLYNLLYSLAFEDEFRRTKVKTKALDGFLKGVAKGTIKEPAEFIKKGVERTFTPALLSLIKEKLRRFAKKYEKDRKGAAALLILNLLHNEIPLSEIPFFVAIFAKSASRRPLSGNNKVWKLLYEFLPKRIEEGKTELMEKPDIMKEYKDRYEEDDSGLLIPKKKAKRGDKSSRIILPGEL